MLTLESMKRIFSRNKIKEDIKQSETESEDATLQMERIARETENFNTHSKKPSLLARVIAPLYRIFRSSGSQNSVEVAESQKVADGVTMFGNRHTEVLEAAREVRLRKTDNPEEFSSPASQATLTSMEENTDLDGLDLEQLGVDDIGKGLDLLQNRTEQLSETSSGFNHLTTKLAERESSLSLFDRFKGLFSRSAKESDTEEHNEESVSDGSSVDKARKPWYRKGALGSAANWFQSIGHRKKYHVMSECDDSKSITSESVGDTEELVQEGHEFTSSTLGFVDISLRSESADGMTIESHLGSVNLENGDAHSLESDDTHSLTPETSEQGKIGLVQRVKNMLKTIGDFFMSPFRASEVDHNCNSYKNFMTSSADDTKFVIVGGTAVNNGGPEGNPLISDAPPSYEEVIKSYAETTTKTSGLHPNNTRKNWGDSIGTKEERAQQQKNQDQQRS